MRVIFLDFDGVLNHRDFIYSARARRREATGSADPKMDLDVRAVRRLNRIVRLTNAVVVVSSSWRHGYALEELTEMLMLRGFKGRVIGVTPSVRTDDGSSAPRGVEIQRWLDDYAEGNPYGCYGIDDVESFVILDDNSDMAHLSSRLVQTTFERGLLDEHVDLAVAMLEKPVGR